MKASAAFFCSSRRQRFPPVFVMALSKPYSCRICGLDFEEHEGRLHGPTFRCKTCESCLRQIRRNVDKPDLENFSDQEQKDFFRKLQAEKAKADGRLPWTVIRASLVTAMTTRSVLAYKAEVHGKKLPLEVWTKKGWSKETIERMPSEYSEEYGCTVYQVKVKSRHGVTPLREWIRACWNRSSAQRRRKARRLTRTWRCLTS